MHDLCKDLTYAVAMVDLLISSDDQGNLTQQELLDLRNLVAQKADAVIGAIESMITEASSGIIS